MQSAHHNRPPVDFRLVRGRALIIAITITLLTMLFVPMSGGAANSTTVTLSPANQVAISGGTAQIFATVTTNGLPDPQVPVIFKVTGANSKTLTGVTNPQGQASVSYSSTEVGTDTVSASALQASSNSVTVQWIATTVAKITLTPATTNAAIGSTASWTATVTDANNQPVSGVQVVYAVNGANAKGATVAGTTDANGKVIISYTGAKGGSDTIKAFTDINTNNTIDVGEFSTTATATWVASAAIALSPTSLTVPTGTELAFTATVTDASNKPVQGAVVNFSISGANPASGQATTDANGQATFKDSGANAGTDTVHASVSGVSGPATATVQWVAGPAALTLTASNVSPNVSTKVTVTATLKDKSGKAISNVKVYFATTGANTSSGSGTTDANGQATFSYTGTKAGADTVSAFADFNGNGKQDTGEPSQTLTITWSGAAAATLSVTPSSQSQVVGTTATLTAQLTKAGGSASGVKIHVSVSGTNSASTTITTDANGKATFTYAGAKAGTDTVTMWADLNGNGSQDNGEPSATATVTWATPSGLQAAQPASPKAGCTYFPQTQHNLCAGFQAYWNQFGGLATYGFPLTEEFVENGMTVQYFERARFEWHPGAWPSRFDVLLGLVGNEVTATRSTEKPFEAHHAKSKSECTHFAETGHNLCAGFRAFWNAYGGLAVYGFPISEEFQEKNPDTGQVYTVQYFQRARFEWHPGEAPARYDVELGRLGAQVLQGRYGVSFY